MSTTNAPDGVPSSGKKKKKANKSLIKSQKFEGLQPDMLGHIFDCHASRSKQIEEFNRTMKVLVTYVIQEYGSLEGKSIKNMTYHTFQEPPAPPTVDEDGYDLPEPTAYERYKLEKKFAAYLAQEEKYEEHMKQIYQLVWGQCSEAMQQKIEDNSSFEQTELDMDVIALIKIIKSIAFFYQDHEYPVLALRRSVYSIYKYTQGRTQSVQDYLRTFIGMVEVARTVGASFGEDDGTVLYFLKEIGINDVNQATDAQVEQCRAKAVDSYLAISFLMGSDKHRFGGLVETLHNDFLKGNNNYPKTLTKCYSLLNNYRSDPRNVPGMSGGTMAGVAFATVEENSSDDKAESDDSDDDDDVALVNQTSNATAHTPVNNNNKKKKKQTQSATSYTGPPCTRCGRDSHPTANCHARKHKNGSILFCAVTEQHSSFDFYQQATPNHHSTITETMMTAPSNPVPTSWILLDSCATADIFCNSNLLSNIHETEDILVIHCNAGQRTTNLKGTYEGYGEVWYAPDGIANVLSLSRVKDKHRVTYDSAADNAFIVHQSSGRLKKFIESKHGPSRLYHFDTQNKSENVLQLVETVDDNKSKYSKHDYSQAVLARKLQALLGRPSLRDFIQLVERKQIADCPITLHDIRNAEQIFGPDLGSLKGKTVRTKAEHVRIVPSGPPPTILDQYRQVIICVDVMRINTIPFLVTITRNIRFGTVERLPYSRETTLFTLFCRVIKLYQNRGFQVVEIMGDNQFACLRDEFLARRIRLNICARDEHVPEIERYTRTIKERVRSVYNLLPFSHIPVLLLVELTYFCVFWLNLVPTRNGISDTMSPGLIVTGREIDYRRHCRLEFGSYVQTHEQHDNSMSSRTIGAIALRPSGNRQGGYYFMSLSTGRRLHRRTWTELPMPQHVIDTVNQMGKRARMTQELVFQYDLGVPFEDADDDNSSTSSSSSSSASDDSSDGSPPGPHDAALDEDDPDPEVSPIDVDAAPDAFPADTADVPPIIFDAGTGVAPQSQQRQQQQHQNIGPNDNDNHPQYDNVGQTQNNQNDDAEIAGVAADDQADNATGVAGNNNNDDEIAGVAADNGPIAGVAADDLDRQVAGVGDTAVAAIEQLNQHAAAVPGAAEIINDQEITFGAGDETDNPLPRTYNNMNLRPRTRLNYRDIHRGTNTLHVLSSRVKRGKIQLSFHTYELRNDEFFCDGKMIMTKNQVILVTPQMSMKKGLQVFKERGEQAVTKELRQLHDMNSLDPRHPKELSYLEKKRALRYLMYLKEKRCGKIKARGCADGRKQRLWTAKHEASSPTVSLGALMISCAIDAKERRAVKTCDIPGAFLQTSMDGEEVVHLLLEGKMAELMAKVDPSLYQQYIFHDYGKPCMYVALKKALYGTLKAALLWWRDLSDTLRSMGFEVNPYDWCVMNKNINGKQCTIIWHVDDLKISHASGEVVDDIIAALDTKYGKVNPLVVHSGPTHDYLGMDVTFNDNGKVTIGMNNYVQEVLKEAPDDMNGTAVTPASQQLFKTNPKADKLSDEDKDFFHHLVAKLLFISKRARPDIQTAVAFLCTRVKGPDKDDWKKLARVVKYLRHYPDLVLTLSLDNVSSPQWWIDGAFAVHDNMRSHTGAYMSLGKGMMFSQSSKQKMTTRSSTEAELVAVDDVMGQVVWTRNFLLAQGYNVNPSVIHQDNQSAMLLEQNGRGSSGKRTRHLDIRYFFVTDRIDAGEVVIRYCPTDHMIGDFFTKPLQGGKFRTMRRIIMNLEDDVDPSSLSTSQECVGSCHNSHESKQKEKKILVPCHNRIRHKNDGGEKKEVTWADIVKRID